MTPVDVLRETRALLATKKCWTQRYNARDAKGRPTCFAAPNAVSWCIEGGCFRVAGGPGGFAAIDYIYSAIRSRSRSGSVASWNDWTRRKHADVVAMLDRAIALAESPS